MGADAGALQSPPTPPNPYLCPMQLKNDLLLRAARGEKTERTPVWMMRQAGRILPEYKTVRNALSGFKELVETPERAAEVTIQPVDILGVDAAIIFSDILVIPEAMGLKYEMIESKGPYFPEVVKEMKDVVNLRIADGETDLPYVGEAIKIVKKELNGRVPVIGFAGAPWTIFAYMTEGKGSKTFSVAKSYLYAQPQFSHLLLQKITESTISYLKSQIKAGADIVQIFDSWAGILGPQQFSEFSLRYIQQICDAISEVPVIVFAKGANYAINDISKTSCFVVGLDWTVSPELARTEAPTKILQGNLDPCVLYADFATIRKETKNMLKAFGPGHHIANLGHGLYPDIDKEKAKCFVETVKEFSYHPTEV
jgi:uroporphyrinogen decarboxylase